MTRAEMRELKAARQAQNGEPASEDLIRKLDETCQKVEGLGSSLISQFGPPAFRSEKGNLKKLNGLFWARYYGHIKIMLFEPNERQFYEYSADSGLWVTQTEELIRKNLAELLEKAAKEWTGFSQLLEFCNEPALQGIITHLKGIVQQEEAFSRKGRLAHLANCVLRFNRDGTVSSEKFSPDFRSRNRSPISYDPHAVCRHFVQSLLSHLDEDDRELLQKYAGQCLLGSNSTCLLYTSPSPRDLSTARLPSYA